MYKVKRAIIMAAGFGSRMLPVTKEIPKPLITVNGKRIIDTVIDALIENDIEEIYVVVGHLKEKFSEILNKYPNIKLVENPYYNIYNNISSLYVVRDYIGSSIIIDADQIIYNKNILSNKFKKSSYCCAWTEDNTKEWVLDIENNRVINCNTKGANKGWQLYGVSRWTDDDATKLKKYVEYEFRVKENKMIYWDDIALNLYPNEFDIGIYEISKGDIVEIDTIQELIDLDKSYNEYIN